VLLTFSGLDGSGKSTLIAGLRDVLESAGRPVVVLTMYDHVGVYAAVRILRDRLMGRPRQPSAPATDAVVPGEGADAAVEAPVGRLTALIRSRRVRRIAYALDLGLFRVYRAYQEQARGRILILDRYFYDSIIELAEGVSEAELLALLRWVPTPDVPIYIDAAPEVAFARKREYSVERLTERARLYRTLFAAVDGALVVPNQHAPASVALERIRARVFAGPAA
jgi:thymidylate kinase